MGQTKHGKNSAKAKKCAQYKAENRRAINKQERATKIANGTYKKKSLPETKDMAMARLLRNTKQTKPFVGEGGAHWGTNKEYVKPVDSSKKKEKKGKDNK